MNERDVSFFRRWPCILASHKEVNPKDQTRPGEVAQWARAYADALIAELTREQVAGGQ
jgi:N-acetyl-anhydromuramyl-L-alanine amidase AmpD